MRFTTLLSLPAAWCLAGGGGASAETAFSAVISADGSLVRGAQVQASKRNAVGKYQLTFKQDISTCSFVASIVGTLGGQTSFQPVDANVVKIFTFDKGGVQADSIFNLVASCVGGLVINEVMANPSGRGVAEASQEWFELFNPTQNAVTLSGLSVSNGSVSQAIACDAIVPPHEFALFAKDTDPAENGGLPSVDCLFSLTLPNSGGRLIVKRGTVVVDKVDFTGTTWEPGHSFSLEPNPDIQDTLSNDDLANWCFLNSPVYSSSANFGTPKTANRSCP